MRAVIIGAGKVGYSLAQHLTEENHEVIVIEQDDARRAVIQNNLDIMTVGGNGASPALLKTVAKDCDLLIAVTACDEVNMLACLNAKHVGVKRTIARVRSQDYMGPDRWQLYERMGIDLAINPEMVTAIEISQTLFTPAALDVEDFAGGKVRLLEVKVRPESPFVNIPLKDLNLPRKILVAGILRHEKMIIPHGSDVIKPNDSVFFVGENHVIKEFGNHFTTKRSRVERVLIIGAGRIGRHLAYLLEKRGLQVKVIDKQHSRCQELAKILKNSLVLCGDGTDIEFLAEEGAGNADAVVCLTDDDKLNLLIALLAKHLGAQKTFVRVGRSEYIPLMEHVGVDVVLSPRLLTVGVILRQVRRGEIVALTLLEGAKAEAFEIVVTPACQIAGKQLRNAGLPPNVLVGAIARGDQVLVPDGNERLLPGDRAVIFTLPSLSNKVVKLFEGRS